jgi:dTMP kinase
MKKAKLIVIEGADGAGKETQTKMLKEYFELKGKKVASLSFPRYTETAGGKLLYFALGKQENKPDFDFSKLDAFSASLPYAMDRFESKSEIEKLLAENDILILDRYFTANLLHQGAKFESEVDRNDYINKISKIELEILEIPKPDLVIYLDLPFEVSLRRLEKRSQDENIKKDSVEMNQEYVKNSIERGRKIANYCDWKVVNCVEDSVELEREEIKNKIIKEIETFLLN